MQWIEIKRDKDGCITEECFNEMMKQLPILIFMSLSDSEIQIYDTLTDINLQDCMGNIYKGVNYTHYLPIPKVES